MEKEVIFKEDLERIFGKRPFKDNFDKLGQEKAIPATEVDKTSETAKADEKKSEETEQETVEEKK